MNNAEALMFKLTNTLDWIDKKLVSTASIVQIKAGGPGGMDACND